MTRIKVRSNLWRSALVLIVLTLAVPALLDVVVESPAHADEDWKAVTLLYTSDIKGKIDPCG